IPIIPLLVGGAEMPKPSELPESIRELAYRNAVTIDSGRDFDHHMNGLVRATDDILQVRSPDESSAAERRPAGGIGSRFPPHSGVPVTNRPAPDDERSNLVLPVVGGMMTALGIM